MKIKSLKFKKASLPDGSASWFECYPFGLDYIWCYIIEYRNDSWQLQFCSDESFQEPEKFLYRNKLKEKVVEKANKHFKRLISKVIIK